MKPFIAALVGGAAGGAWVVSMHVYMTAVGLTADPGMAIVQSQLAAELHYRNGDRLRRGLRAL